jgi:ribose-phosphate pyrophosphokinase
MVTVEGFESKFWKYPAGERGVKLVPLHKEYDLVVVRMEFEGSDDLIDVMLACNALRQMFGVTLKISLDAPYFPYARQDRFMSDGEALSLQVIVVMLAATCGFNFINTWDAHSSVLQGMISSGGLINVPQHLIMTDLFVRNVYQSSNKVFVSPDAGAVKKIYPLARDFKMPVIEASKTRDVETGEISNVKINNIEGNNLTGIIVDDIIDGGKTFIQLAQAMEKTGRFDKIILMATHGIFSKGLEPLDCIDEIYVANHVGKFVTPEQLLDFNKRK